MSVSYENLWLILENKGLTKKKLMDDTGMSPTTMALISHNKVVSMNTIITICEYLGCDVGDVVHLMPQEQETKESITKYISDLGSSTILKNAVEEYITKNNLTKNQFVQMAKISNNTLSKILAGERVNFSVYKKLMAFMSKEIIRNVDLYLGKN